MTHPRLDPTNVRLLLPETLWLEAEHFDKARKSSNRWEEESQQWQAYLNSLASSAFQTWLEEKTSAKAQEISSDSPEAAYLRIQDFKLCVLAQEHVLDDVLYLPQQIVEQPELTAHCYALLEVLEDEEEAIIRGFLRYDELMPLVAQSQSNSAREYLLPLSSLDAEIDRLVAYLQYSQPSAIPLPAVATQAPQLSTTPATPASAPAKESLRTRLGQWLDGTLAEGWQALDKLINPEASLSWSMRKADEGVKGGKLLNLGMQLGQKSVVLLVTVVREDEEKLGINIQLLPTGGDAFLPPQLTARLVSSTDKILQSVTSRERDNFIQMKPFKGKPGIRFNVEVELNDIKLNEAFEL